MRVTIDEVLTAALRCGGHSRDISPKEIQDYISVNRPDAVAHYKNERSFRMTVEAIIEGCATNRVKGKSPFGFDGLERGFYRLRSDVMEWRS